MSENNAELTNTSGTSLKHKEYLKGPRLTEGTEKEGGEATFK